VSNVLRPIYYEVDDWSFRTVKHDDCSPKYANFSHREKASNREHDSRISGSTAHRRVCASAGKRASEANSPGDDCSTNFCNNWTVTLFCVTTGYIFVTHFICSIYVLQHKTLL
jgi:hypothetical protein